MVYIIIITYATGEALAFLPKFKLEFEGTRKIIIKSIEALKRVGI